MQQLADKSIALADKSAAFYKKSQQLSSVPRIGGLPQGGKRPLEEFGEAKEYGETQYFGTGTSKYWKNKVEELTFWEDYAAHSIAAKKDKPFLSNDFISAFNNFTEVFAVLALIDLPYESTEPGWKATGARSMELKAPNNLFIFKKEVHESKGSPQTNILIAQRYVDWELKSEQDTQIEEFIINHIYSSQVIITSISSNVLEFDVLVQIPEGSIPLSRSTYLKSFPVTLASYTTTKIEIYFYFPAVGKFTQYPASVSINGVVVAKANPLEINVIKEKTHISETNYREVLSEGDSRKVINFLKQNPITSIKDFNWEYLYWMLPDKDFFIKIIALLREQRIYDPITWSYSLLHKTDQQSLLEYLDSNDPFKSSIGYYFNSKLVKVRPIDSGVCLLDYYPLFNSRAHSIRREGDTPVILNYNLNTTYRIFLTYLSEKKEWESTDIMNLAYFLLLQDRVQEAISFFNKIEPIKEGTFQIQYDYMAAFLDFYVGGPKYSNAREIVKRYIDYPVLSWRLLFIDMEQQLREYDGEQIDQLDIEEEEKKELSRKKPISVEQHFSVSLMPKEVTIEYSNISEVSVKYYIIDLEILFSRTPFIAEGAEDFGFLKPNSEQTIQLDPKQNQCNVKIPDIYLAMNVLIELNAGGIKKLLRHFSSSLIVQMFENYGELRVSNDKGEQLPQVYVKAFVMKKDNKVEFYKDGYTDIRGRFDYVSLNASKLAQTKKFAIFIMSDKYGSLIKECSPPIITINADDGFGKFRSAGVGSEIYSKGGEKF